MYSILIIEDDKRVADLLKTGLEENGYHTMVAYDGAMGLRLFQSHSFQLVISDIILPKMDGFELCKEIRNINADIPILMLTALGTTGDKLDGFNAGADDYMVKPVNVNEMVLRVQALLRRAQMINERRQVIGGTLLECDSLTVTTENDSFVLPQKEFMLLYKMASYPGRIFTRQQLMDEIWGYENESDTHTVDVHIGRLRERFRDSKFYDLKIQNIEYLQTIKDKAIDRITISMLADEIDDRVVEELNEILRDNPGSTKLFISLHDAKGKNHVLLRSNNRTVDVKQGLIAFIEQTPALDYKIN